MNWMEVALLVLGAGAFVASFVLPDRKQEGEGQEIDPELIRSLIDKEMADARTRVSEVVDETLDYAVEKTERASERISNEKIMAISEYSETVLADMNKTHQEIIFLYDMLNDKHKNLKETAQKVDKTAKEAEEKVNAVANALVVEKEPEAKLIGEPVSQAKEKPVQGIHTIKVQEDKDTAEKQQRITLDMLESVLPKPEPEMTQPVVQEFTPTPVEFHVLDTQKLPEVKEFSFTEQAPHLERPVRQEKQAVNMENTVSMMKNTQTEEEEVPVQENSNDKILRLHKEGKTTVDIAKELGLGVGEVKLVINLFKGA